MIIYYLYFHPTGIDVPFLSQKRQKPVENLPIELPIVQPISASTSALDERSNSRPPPRVQRTLSEPPETTVKTTKCTRSWKTMQR